MNIFVTRLSPNTDEDGLIQLFSNYGEVSSAKVIMDRETGRSKCYGFVEMDNDDEGMTAIEELNDSEVDGNTIVVKKSDPKPDRNNNFRNNRNNNRRDFNRDNNRDNNRRDNNRRDNNRSGRDDKFDTSRW